MTGGARGIGRAIVLRLAAEGATLGVLDRDAAGLRQVADELATVSAMYQTLQVDITDAQAVEEAVAVFETESGPIDGLVNNAGWDHAAPFLETDPELWKKIIDINLYGPLHMSHAVLRRMNERGSGRVVSIASDAGRVGSTGESVYAACKGGIISFSKSVARELARQGITMNVVCPGPTDTQLFADFDATGKLGPALARAIPMGRLGQPEDLPGLVTFLLSDDAAFMTGQAISVSGGLTMHG